MLQQLLNLIDQLRKTHPLHLTLASLGGLLLSIFTTYAHTHSITLQSVILAIINGLFSGSMLAAQAPKKLSLPR